VLRAGLRYVAAHGLSRSVEAALYYMLAERLIELGRWDEAAAVLEANRGRDVGGIPAYFTTGYRARLAAFRGETEVVAEAAAETFARATEIPQQPLPHAIALLAEIEQSLWSGSPERAVSSAVEALRLSEGDLECAADALAVLARAEADAADQCRLHGQPYTPVVATDDLLRRAHEGDLPAHARVHALTLMVRAEAERMNGTRDPDAWRTAVEAWTAAADPYWAAYARWRLGWALLRSRSGRTEATRELRSAHQAATTLGANPLRAAIEDLVAAARLQVGSSPAATLAVDLGLTGRELEVLPLLAAGRTNAEIADLLVISPRTVGVHVSQILHKLGASRRTEAADLARRAGLLGH
jgi:DNA-binding CsgD family transcriptional regulator